jgi:hypothetical protein
MTDRFSLAFEGRRFGHCFCRERGTSGVEAHAYRGRFPVKTSGADSLLTNRELWQLSIRAGPAGFGMKGIIGEEMMTVIIIGF